MSSPRTAAPAELSFRTKTAIVLTTLAQGVGVYICLRSGWVSAGVGRLIALSLLLALPSFFVLCVRDVQDRLLWRSLALLTALLGALHASVWWLLQGAETGDWAGWLLSQGVFLFIALAWVQALLQQRSLRGVPYADLFESAWNNALVLGFALQFVGLCWAVLGLWAGLFVLIKVQLFADTFTQPAFACIATGLMAGLGVVLARGQPKPLRLMLQLLLALYRLLLPLLALVVVLFVLALPLTGVQPLWETRKAAPLLMGVLLALLVFVNAVFQNGQQQQAPYPAPLRGLIAAALGLMPVLAGLAVWAVALRVRQYGWTTERVWAATAAAVLLLYALGYAWAALQRGGAPWLGRLARINPALSWLVMALLLLLHTPILDPYRLGVESQYQRLASGVQEPTRIALQDLRFDHGRYGRPALERLQQLPAFAQEPVAQSVQEMLAATTKRYLPRKSAATTVAMLQQHIAVAPGHAAPPDDWWQALTGPHLSDEARNCVVGRPQRHQPASVAPAGGAADPQTAPCVTLQLPLQSGSAELQRLLCKTMGYVRSCDVFVRNDAGQWEIAGTLSWPSLTQEQRAQLAQALRAGQLQVQAPRWQEVGLPQAPDVPAGQVQPR